MAKTKTFPYSFRIEQEVKDAIAYLRNRGYSVSFKLKMYIMQLYEQEKNRELIDNSYTPTSIL